VIQELRTGGAERIVVTLARDGVVRGDTVAVAAAPGELVADLPEGCRHYPLPVLDRKTHRVPHAALRLRSVLRSFRPDVVHVHNPAMALLAGLAGAGRRAASFVSVHGVPEEDWSGASRLLRLSRLAVVACGPGVAAALDESGCAPIATIRNGVSPPPPAITPSELREMFDLPAGVRVLLVVGRLVPQKNQALALAALVRLDDDVRLVIVGEGPDRDALEATARQLGVAERVVFAGRRTARPLMAGADVICLPSRWEGMPLVGVEAMTSGRPLVVTAVRGNRELVDDGRTGLVVAPDDPEALAAAIRRLLDDPTFAATIGAQAHALASGWTDAAMAAAYAELYGRLARERLTA
jgi:glycosyltransferase involved in cell wall biosynthesis